MDTKQNGDPTKHVNGGTRWSFEVVEPGQPLPCPTCHRAHKAPPTWPGAVPSEAEPQLSTEPERVPEPGPATCIGRFLEHLRESKLTQWLVTYLAVAWLTLQLVQTLGEIWPLPIVLQQAVSLVLGLSLLPAGVIAWFHGERGRQRVCALEAVILGALLVLTGTTVWQVFV